MATELSKLLFNRLLEINPGLELPHHDPKVYQTKPWMDKKPVFHSPGQKLESEAIIQQLFSGFISSEPKIDLASGMKYNIQEILVFIHDNLHIDIKINSLRKSPVFRKTILPVFLNRFSGFRHVSLLSANESKNRSFCC